MNTVESALLKQMQKLAGTIGSVPGAGKNQNGQNAVSFQEMLQQSGGKTNKPAEAKDSGKETPDKPLKDVEEAVEEAQNPQLPQKDEEELKAENLTGNPNAVNVMDLFRPEIVEDPEQAGTVVDPIPQETVEGAAMDLSGEAPAMETGVDAGIGAEVSMEQQPKDFQQAMEETPQQQPMTEDAAVQTQRQEAPRQTVQTAEKDTETPEVQVQRGGDADEPTGEAAAAEQPVFHEAEAVPVKVGERYEVVDTQQPEMDDQMADLIRTAVQTGQERVVIRLDPQNLGSLVIEMTKDTTGVLQVVLHAATPKAEGLLNQHLSNLHTALQAYGHEEVRIEVQRGEESQQQNFRQADPDGRGQHQQRQQQEHHEEKPSGEEFMQKLRLGLTGMEE